MNPCTDPHCPPMRERLGKPRSRLPVAIAATTRKLDVGAAHAGSSALPQSCCGVQPAPGVTDHRADD